MTEIDNLLYRLGATANYTGFRYISCALHLCIQQPEQPGPPDPEYHDTALNDGTC